MKVGEYIIDDDWTRQDNYLYKNVRWNRSGNCAGEFSISKYYDGWHVRIDIFWREYDYMFGEPRSIFPSAESAKQSFDIFFKKFSKLKAFI